MRTEQKSARPIDVEQAQPTDPLAGLASTEVLRCHNPETGWVWFYAREEGVVRKFHAYHDFSPELVSRTEVADTVGLEAVESERVGLGELEWERGVGR
ncbi:hypothetical protein HYG81_22315 (plasmid) [Natrinema zhouii]|uniref:hypothetical protein n=1 Tax=Natrinema zhouii TaxID=1710539 RepID=UPI001CFF7F11|nr:hypothetical protein [Natrinema zhouii]UHQ98702.1 hypothetical protein HYG81_22315 [Natrinema zhouii]